MRDVSLDVRAPEIVAVVGRKAEGKSTLAAGILGQIECSRGVVGVNGTISYVAQSAFITNDSIRNNILFGSPFDEPRYRAAVSACALEQDLKTMTAGDATQVGERGVTLSGGQKQRVALARAAYANAQCIIADDPLSAMDAHVALHVFKRCFRGLMRTKAVLLLTNQMNFAASCDKIVFLDAGVAAVGTYAELRASNASFAQLAEHELGSSSAVAEMTVIDTDQPEHESESAPERPAESGEERPSVATRPPSDESKDESKQDAEAATTKAETELKGKIMKQDKQAKGKQSLKK